MGQAGRRCERGVRGAVASSGRPVVLALAVLLLVALRPAPGQLPVAGSPPADSSAASSAARRVRGRVVLPGNETERGVAGVWVVLHRVGSDRAGPLDSTRSGGGGAFSFAYRAVGEADALYFVSAQYGGIAYFSQPLRRADVSGEDAEIVVFDTTSARLPLHVRGRHVVVGAARVDGARDIVEVYELSNDSSVTVVSRDDSSPTWSASVPASATDFLPGQGDVGADAIRLERGRVVVLAPFAPGVKQISFTYRLPGGSFPWNVSLGQSTDLLEVLLEDSSATVSGATLAATAPAAVEGRTFRRFLANDVAANAVARVVVPAVGRPWNALYVAVLALVIGSTMLVALARAFARRPRTAAVSAREPPQTAEALARAVAALDGWYESQPEATTQERAAYLARRAELKSQLARALAGGKARA